MKKRKLLAIFMAMMMLSSTGAVLASCKDEQAETPTVEDETPEEEETVPDDYIVTNAGFETFDDKDGENLIVTSVNGWSRSTNSTASGSAKSSTAASGIIDTADAAWKNLTTSGLDGISARELTQEQAKANWDKMTAKDKLEFYEAWEENDNDKDVEDLDFYQSFNIDEDDLPLYRVKDDEDKETATPIANPGTHDNSTENTKVLMIHNEYSTTNYEKFGTAQKFTSSSKVTVSAGTSAKFSVWVKTSNLEMVDTQGNVQEALDRGAYIEITNSLGGTSLDPVRVENIQANDWTKYEFVLKGSEYADATFTIVLGLGQSGGDDRFAYVNGYAFFDDIKCETVLSDEVNLADYTEKKLDDNAEDKIVNASVNKLALDFSGVSTSVLALDDTKATDTREEATSSAGTDYYTSVSKQLDGTALPTGIKTWEGLGFNPEKDIVKVFDNADAMKNENNAYLQTAYENYFKDVEFLKNEKVLMLLSASGASYTATQTTQSLTPNSYAFISFFVKTSNMSAFTGAGVAVKDSNGEIVSTLSSIDTSSIEGVKVGDNEDIYNGWQKCFVFLSNETDETQDYSIDFTFGPTTISDTTKASYQTGFAAFAQMERGTLTEEQFSYAQSGTYALIANLDANAEEESSDNGFDSVSTGTKIEKGYADLKNFKGVTPDSAYIRNSTDFNINTLRTAGLLSKDELVDEDTNAENGAYLDILAKLGATGNNIEEKWNSVFGNSDLSGYASKQPLVIYNESEQAYGFIGATTNITDYTVVSYNVKVSENAVANFYLIDTDSKDKGVMSIEGKTAYFYDKDGNICSVDPTSSDFNSKKDVAFKLQKNGLYKLNAGWKYATHANKDAFYANLGAYEKDSDHNLIVAENGVSYNYNNKWRNDGNDGIAFYYKDGKYYADSAKTVEVLDLASVTALEKRADAYGKQNMQITVNGNDLNGEWATVTFYIHPGDSGKNYRLEVWSGSRDDAVKNPANSYVIVDSRTPDALTAETFATYTENRQEDLKQMNKLDEWCFESVFSFYDNAKFLRYNEELDENGVGNSYDDFDPTSADYAKGVAFLRYENGNTYEVYADYATVDKTVVADVDETEDETEEEEEEKPESEINVWLLVSSISMTAVLLLVIILIIFRKALGGKKRKNRAKKVKAKKEKPAKKAKAVEEEKDEDSPYND